MIDAVLAQPFAAGVGDTAAAALAPEEKDLTETIHDY